ncbi:hypothetical protein A2U01_0106869, partial [Trifolium medium]|nr:hypothetical protein [Trifolium medium]
MSIWNAEMMDVTTGT